MRSKVYTSWNVVKGMAIVESLCCSHEAVMGPLRLQKSIHGLDRASQLLSREQMNGNVPLGASAYHSTCLDPRAKYCIWTSQLR